MVWTGFILFRIQPVRALVITDLEHRGSKFL